jgi:hypothetical protein
MRTSLNDIREIEGFIDGTMAERETVVFEQRIRREPLLRINVNLHQKVIALIRMYHRKRLKARLEEVHERIFSDPMKESWREKVLRLFHDN